MMVSGEHRRAGWEVLTIGGVKIGKNLRRVREERLLTQQELADAADLGLSTVLRIENDRVEPRFSTIRKLARALEVDARELTRKEG
jgi:transcriptional regulator with XRE-family HTH domain